MELVHQEAAVEAAEGVSVEGVAAAVGWEVIVPGQDLVSIVSVPVVEQDYPIKQGHPATT